MAETAKSTTQTTLLIRSITSGWVPSANLFRADSASDGFVELFVFQVLCSQLHFKQYVQFSCLSNLVTVCKTETAHICVLCRPNQCVFNACQSGLAQTWNWNRVVGGRLLRKGVHESRGVDYTLATERCFAWPNNKSQRRVLSSIGSCFCVTRRAIVSSSRPRTFSAVFFVSKR